MPPPHSGSSPPSPSQGDLLVSVDGVDVYGGARDVADVLDAAREFHVLEVARTVKVVYPLPHSGIPPPSLGSMVKVAVLVGPRRATTGS